MAAAISMTQNVISFATAFKNLYEVYEQLEDTCSKLPRNISNARKLMKDVSDMMKALEEIYNKDIAETHSDVSPQLRKLLNTLETDMQDIHKKCSSLVLPVKVKKRENVKIVIYLFRNRTKIEKMLTELKDRLNRVLQSFRLRSAISMQGNLAKFDNAWRGRIVISAPAGLNIFNNTTHDIVKLSDAQLFNFAESFTMPMTWIPETIPMQDLCKAHLRLEIDNMAKTFRSLTVRLFTNLPAEINVPPLKVSWFLDRIPLPREALDRDALMLTFRIQEILESKDEPISVRLYKANTHLTHLATYLGDLQMYQEAVSVGTSRVEVWTEVVKAYPKNPQASEHLASAITNLSTYLFNMGELDKSRATSAQAIKLIQESYSETFPSVPTAHVLLAKSYNQNASNYSEPSAALKLKENAVRVIEEVMGIHTQIPTDEPLVEGQIPDATAELSEGDTSDDLLYMYATVLSHLGGAQIKSDLPVLAKRRLNQALVIVRNLQGKYPGSLRILDLQSLVLLYLCDFKLFHHNTSEENTQYTQERVDVWTQLTTVNPQKYAMGLFYALHRQSYDFRARGMSKEVQIVHQEMLSMRSMTVDPYKDLQLPSESEADYYLNLSRYHFMSERYPDAIHAARNALSQHIALESLTPGQNPIKHITVLATLCSHLVTVQRYDEALVEGFKALELIDRVSIRGDNPAIITKHMELLNRMMEALEISSDSKVLEWAKNINFRIQKLFLSSGGKIDLHNAQATHRYIEILRRHDLLDEAQQYTLDILRYWDKTYGNLDRMMIGISYLQCLTVLPNILEDRGEIDKALEYNQQAMVFAQNFHKSSDQLKPFALFIMSFTHIRLLWNIGLYKEAFERSKLDVEKAHKSGNRYIITRALTHQTYCQLNVLAPNDAITTATTAITLCKKELSESIGQRPYHQTYGYLYALYLNMSGGLGDTGDIDMALKYLQMARNALEQDEIHSGQVIGSDIHSYLVMATRKSRLLFAKGPNHYDEAASLIKDVINKQRARTQARPYFYSALSAALRFAGILYCALGRHEEGADAAGEVAAIKRNVADKLPNVARLIDVEESLQESRGLWESVQIAMDSLTCNHQKY